MSSNVVFVGSLPYAWTPDVIKSVLCGTGRITDVKCFMESPDKNKGFCFVEYLTADEAERAANLICRIFLNGKRQNPYLRAEVTKDGQRPNGVSQRPEMYLDRNSLPPYVNLPEEMLQDSTNTFNNNNNNNNTVNNNANNGTNLNSQFIGQFMQQIAQNPQLQQVVQQMLGQGMDINQIVSIAQTYMSGTPTSSGPPASLPPKPMVRPSSQTSRSPAPPASSHAVVIPEDPADYLSRATQNLPPMDQVPLVTSLGEGDETQDKINESLSAIPPPSLIELISNIRKVLDSEPDKVSAHKQVLTIFSSAPPSLALGTAQTLLLMGLIDSDVISKSMNQAAPSTSLGQGGNPSMAQPQPPAPPSMSSNVPREWQGLPERTIAKLQSVSEGEANLIVQVLQLSPDQVINLPVEQKSMVEALRSQYL